MSSIKDREKYFEEKYKKLSTKKSMEKCFRKELNWSSGFFKSQIFLDTLAVVVGITLVFLGTIYLVL